MGPTVRPALPESARRLWRYLRRCVRIDTRTLAVFRVFVGLLVVADLLLRSRNVTFFYTDGGVVPRSLAMDGSPEYAVSVYYLTTDPTLIAALFVLQGLIAVALVAGYRTRIATVLTFLFVVSLDHHNPFVLSYADTLFRLLLFWAIFLPLGERWSIDAVHRDRPPRPWIANAATALILGQMVFMYVTNGLIKAQSPVWTGGDAAPLVFGIDEMTFLLGDYFREVPALLSAGGLLWFLMLVFAWLLILLRGRPRMLVAGLFVGGHLSFALTVRIGAFAYVALAGVILFLQAQFWDDLAAVAGRAGVDGARLEALAVRLAALARRVPNPRLPGDRVTRLRSRAYDLGLAVVVVTILFVAVAVAASAAPAALEGGDDQPVADRVDAEIERTLAETAGVRQVETVASSLSIDQPMGWGVFAGPGPRTTDRYYVFPAETASGEQVDAYNERPLTYERPYDELQHQHGTYRERFYMNSVRRSSATNAVPAQLAAHLCDTWADDHGEELVAVNMYVVEEEITHETIDDPDERERTYTSIYRHGCGDNDWRVIEPPPE